MALNEQQRALLEAYDSGASAIVRGFSIGFDSAYPDGEFIPKESVMWILDHTYLHIKSLVEEELKDE